MATRLDTGHLHNHLVVNSVSCVDGRKLHQNAADLQAHRNANDTICQRHGLSILQKAKRHNQKERMAPGEYQAGLRGESWKWDLILAINEALEYADDRESFIENMEQEGYQVVWTDTRKHITVITPDLPPFPTWSENKQRSREALKKLAHGQKIANEESYGYDFEW